MRKPESSSSIAAIRLLYGIIGLSLFMTTWPLWWPGTPRFPLVPFSSGLTSTSFIIDHSLFCTIVVALSLRIVFALRDLLGRNSLRIEQRTGWLFPIVFGASALALILLNQHRLQVWLLHFLILLPLLQSASHHQSQPSATPATPESRLTGTGHWHAKLTLITAAIYCWSAVSKLDVSFLHTHGQHFVEAICGALGISTRFWTPTTRIGTAAALPIGELLVALLLIIPRTRRVGLILSLVMHGLLLLAVGPWGLNHSNGVILWNVFLLGQNLLLLLSRADNEAPNGIKPPGRCSSRLATGAVVVAFVLPALRLTGHCDDWPAWAVYASNSPRILVQIRDTAVDRLPAELHQFVEQKRLSDGWSWFRIDHWSMTELGSPIYPTERFHFAVARAIIAEYSLTDGIQLIREGEADRLTGKRTIEPVADTTELSDRFHFNTVARSRQ